MTVTSSDGYCTSSWGSPFPEKNLCSTPHGTAERRVEIYIPDLPVMRPVSRIELPVPFPSQHALVPGNAANQHSPATACPRNSRQFSGVSRWQFFSRHPGFVKCRSGRQHHRHACQPAADMNDSRWSNPSIRIARQKIGPRLILHRKQHHDCGPAGCPGLFAPAPATARQFSPAENQPSNHRACRACPAHREWGCPPFCRGS